jgi:ribosome biogenesis protein BMS1
MEDITPAEPLRLNPKADRQLLLYGYLRGAPLRPGSRLHLAGVGDFDLQVPQTSGGGGVEDT